MGKTTGNNNKSLITTTSILAGGAANPNEKPDMGKTMGTAVGMAIGSGTDLKSEDLADIYVKAASLDAMKNADNGGSAENVTFKDMVFFAFKILAYIACGLISAVIVALLTEFWWVVLLLIAAAIFIIFCVPAIKTWITASKRRKRAAIIIAAAMVVTSVAVVGIHFCRRTYILDLAKTSFSEDFEEHLKSLSSYGLDISGTYELEEETYENGSLKLECIVTYTGNDLVDYLDVGYQSKEAQELCYRLKSIYYSKRNHSNYSYSGSFGNAEIEVRNGYTIDINTTDENGNPHIFTYENSAGFDWLEIDGKIRFFWEQGQRPK